MQDLQTLKSLVAEANSIIILTAKDPEMDCVAASLALYLSLKDSGKQVTIASQSEPIVRDSHLVGLDKIVKEIGNTNIVITIDTPQDSIEKVSHNDDGGKFNLVIEPKKEVAPLDKSKIQINYTGANADLVIIVGGRSVQDAGSIITQEEDLLKNAKLGNISNKSGNFGAVNIIDTQSSLSELTTAVIKELNLTLGRDAAANLVQGIMAYTNNLQADNMTADTFEALAILYRSGAKRASSPIPLTSEPIDRPVPSSPTTPRMENINGDQSPSPDWLKPKIYKGSSKLQ